MKKISFADPLRQNWKGTEANGAQRGPIKIACADGAPCNAFSIVDFAMWTETGSKQLDTCRSAYGSGSCLKGSKVEPFASYAAITTTVTAAPTGYSAASMKDDLKTAFGTTVSIPIPTIPTSYYPGATPYKKVAGT